MANADCIIIQGSNMAECHPVGFQWVEEARARGARVIHVDPRFTRTSAVSDKHIPIRAGSDVVLLGALINHVLTNDLWFKEYVVAYTNAATLINENFRDAEDLGGLFSGFDPDTGQYDPSTWAYQEAGQEPEVDQDESGNAIEAHGGTGDALGDGGPPLAHARVVRDETLQHPRTVFQILKRHYARYTPEMVQGRLRYQRREFRLPGPGHRREFRARTHHLFRVRRRMDSAHPRSPIHPHFNDFAAADGQRRSPGQRHHGAARPRQHPGLHGHSDVVQSAPGIPADAQGGHPRHPRPTTSRRSGRRSRKASGPTRTPTWSACSRRGGATRPGRTTTGPTTTCPRLTGPHGTYQTVMGMLDDEVEGYFLLGQNPAVGSAHGRMQRLGMAHLKWLVVRDLNMIESATWWKDGPEIASGELKTEDIETEVFFFPAATHVEKKGSFTQTQRLLQWRHKAVEPPGDCQSELQFFYELGKRIRQRLAGSTDERDRPLLDLTWDYPTDEHGDPDGEAVLAEYNGYHLTGPDAGKPVSSFTELRADGSTAAGCWIYAGVYADGVNQAARRVPHGGPGRAQSEWGWAWPADRRILYNRASADPDGKPWSERKKLIWWDDEQGLWVGDDVPDFVVDRAPGSRPDPELGGPAALAGDDPFIMQADGKGWLFAPEGRGRRTAAHALRTAGVAGRQRALPATAESRRE